MIPQRVRIALLLGFLFHGFFILTARYRLSYDAYTHMLFANHYAENWFSLWETRWYTGFTVVSYPPLVHQLTALLAKLAGIEAAFALVLWTVTTSYPLAIYAFSRIFTGASAASYAALASAILLPIYVISHIFGQLPFLASTLLAFLGAASLNRYLRDGGIHHLLLTILLTTTTMAAHHATLLVQPFLIFTVLVSRFAQWRSQTLRAPGRNLLVLGRRLALSTVLSVLTSIIVIWPFWDWGMNQTMQTPIDHPSRHNFFIDPLAQAIFFWPLYGPLVLIMPLLFQKWPLRFFGLITSFSILLLLGLGGTTPLPRFLFGEAWEWLTFDRFAFWACLMLTPFFGITFIRLKSRWRDRFKGGLLPVSFYGNIFSAFTFSIFAITALGAWLTPLLFPIQPEPIDMEPIVEFLNDEKRSQWRYLTFGFGDQFAYLNLLTRATTIDGSYHTARTLPELRESGIGQVDTVYWTPKGVSAIIPILQVSGQHGVRWGFVNPDILVPVPARWGFVQRNPFIPALEERGWIKIRTLKNGILVYENPSAVLPAVSKSPFAAPITSFSWGVLPILAFVTTSVLGSLRIWPRQAENTLRGVHALIVGLIPLALCFWYYRTIVAISHDRVYFTYDHALFFLSDALVLFAVILWLSVKITHPQKRTTFKLGSLLSNRFILLAILLLASLSFLWSSDWRTSLYMALHFWLVFALILSLREWSEAWKPALYGFCAALSIQLISGYAAFALQSTSFLNPLRMNWPGTLDVSMAGISAIHLSDGWRVLRPYGTLPHPNILGGFTLLSLLGPAALFLAAERPNYAALLLFALGISLLALTFSRSAWLGLIAIFIILILKSRFFDRKRLMLLLLTTVMSFAITLYPYSPLVRARTTNIAANSERFSFTGRVWLNQEAIRMIREHPLTGVGAGAFIIELSRRAGEGYIIEPVHNLFLLAGAELGIAGMILLAGLFIAIILHIFQAQDWKTILAGATIAGLGVISLFDHYLWTIAPGRLMLGLILGLWAGQLARDKIIFRLGPKFDFLKEK